MKDPWEVVLSIPWRGVMLGVGLARFGGENQEQRTVWHEFTNCSYIRNLVLPKY